MQRPLLAIRAGVQAPDRLITSAWLSIRWAAAKPSSLRYFIFYYYNYLMDTRSWIYWHLNGTGHTDQSNGSLPEQGSCGKNSARSLGIDLSAQ